MNEEEQFHGYFSHLEFPQKVKESFIAPIFKATVEGVLNRLGSSAKEMQINPLVFLNYVVNEHLYNIQGLDENLINSIENNQDYRKKLVFVCVDKIFFNEYVPYQATSLVSRFSPVVSTFNFYLNFILDRLNAIKSSDKRTGIILDMLQKAFLMSRSVINLLISGFETEAFSTWRTIHEIECVIRVLYDNPELYKTYEIHISYNRAFRDEYEDKNYQQSVIDDLKNNMRIHDLKSKDMKKYIEYGWLFGIPNLMEKYPTLKLNFRNGTEMVAGLNEYSSLYEMSSEIAHSSPILIYSNKEYFKSTTIIALYETFIRIEEIFSNILKSLVNVESKSYFMMRNVYLVNIKMILEKEKLLYQARTNRKEKYGVKPETIEKKETK